MREVFVYCKNDSRETMHKAGLLAARRAVLCAAQERGTSVSAGRISIKKDALGKPIGHVPGITSDIALSISHSFPFAYAVAEASSRGIGVDVERVREFKQNVWEAFLTTKEKHIIAVSPQKEQHFLRTLAWALKESALKAYGTGIRTHPNRIDVSRFLKREKASAILDICGTKYSSDTSWKRVGSNHILAVVALRLW